MNIAKTKSEIAAQNAVISAFKAAFAKHMTLASVAAGQIAPARKWYNECNNASEASAQFVREAKAAVATDREGRDWNTAAAAAAEDFAAQAALDAQDASDACASLRLPKTVGF